MYARALLILNIGSYITLSQDGSFSPTNPTSMRQAWKLFRSSMVKPADLRFVFGEKRSISLWAQLRSPVMMTGLPRASRSCGRSLFSSIHGSGSNKSPCSYYGNTYRGNNDISNNRASESDWLTDKPCRRHQMLCPIPRCGH